MLREQLRLRAVEEGGESLLAELAEFDPSYADTLHPNNINRIIRGIEIYRTTGMTMSEHRIRSRQVPSRFAPCLIGLNSVSYTHLDVYKRQVLVFGQTFLESYYIHNKKNELRDLKREITSAYQNSSNKELQQGLDVYKRQQSLSLPWGCSSPRSLLFKDRMSGALYIIFCLDSSAFPHFLSAQLSWL